MSRVRRRFKFWESQLLQSERSVDHLCEFLQKQLLESSLTSMFGVDHLAIARRIIINLASELVFVARLLDVIHFTSRDIVLDRFFSF